MRVTREGTVRQTSIAAVLWLCCGLPQAQTPDPLLDFSLVVPPTPDKHVLIRPAVLWEVRPDAATYCEQAKEQDGQAAWREGCVFWNKSGPGCTIVTTGKTTHSVMGHLFLLCLQAGQAS